MNKTNVIILFILLALLGVGALVTYYFYKTPNDASNSDAKRTLTLGDGVSFLNLNGEPVSFEAYEGKVRVVNVWASWTPFSAQELPLLEEIAGMYKEREVAVIAINRNESKELAKRYLETLGTFTNLVVALDPIDGYFETIEGYAMPETLFYDSRGTIVFHKRGNMTRDEIIAHIEEVLAKQNQ